MPPLKAIRRCIDAIGGPAKGKRSGARARVALTLRVSEAYVSRMYGGEREPTPEVALVMVTEARRNGFDACLNEILPSVYPLSALELIRPARDHTDS